MPTIGTIGASWYRELSTEATVRVGWPPPDVQIHSTGVQLIHHSVVAARLVRRRFGNKLNCGPCWCSGQRETPVSWAELLDISRSVDATQTQRHRARR